MGVSLTVFMILLYYYIIMTMGKLNREIEYQSVIIFNRNVPFVMIKNPPPQHDHGLPSSPWLFIVRLAKHSFVISISISTRDLFYCDVAAWDASELFYPRSFHCSYENIWSRDITNNTDNDDNEDVDHEAITAATDNLRSVFVCISFLSIRVN